ncbi:MAG: type II secretion system F family protein [Acidobacteria bacterium]|nr:type II secretion system F family protein [Acidobacteriota bacterium]
MTPVTVFIGILVITFVVMIVMLRPTQTEKTLEKRLRTIERASVGVIPDEAADLLRQEKMSDIPWLNEMMLEWGSLRKLNRLLHQAESDWTVGKLISITLILFVLGTWVANFRAPSIVLALIAGAGVGSLPTVFLFIKRWRRLRKFEELLPDTIDLMARALRAGHTISSAIEMVAAEGSEPVASEFRQVFEQQNFGLPLREAMLGLAERIPLPDVSFLVTAILVQKETGGNLAEVLDKTAIVIRERFRLRGQLRVYTAQGRLTGWILAGLPFIMFVLLNIVNPAYMRILITDPAGRTLIYVGIVLMVVGGWVIRKVIDIKV